MARNFFLSLLSRPIYFTMIMVLSRRMSMGMMQKVGWMMMGLVLAWPTSAERVLGSCNRYMGMNQKSCKTGMFHHDPGHTSEEYRWSCRNIPYDGEVFCSETKYLTELGECGEVYWGPYDASCKSGKYAEHRRGHTARKFRWVCQNVPHNGEVECSLPRPRVRR